MGLRRVNIRTVELGESLDRAGFRHAATSLGDRLGARRIGASVYRAEPDAPIWPYHYHHGIEEWLHVLSGAPVLREPAGERVLAPGDLVCFPSGHLGAHTLKGPGRFVIFATGRQVEPHLSVYPDSDKVSGPQGILLRSSAVGYWHGEGTEGPSEPAAIAREPGSAPPRPVVDVLTARPEAAPALGALLGAERLDATLVDLEPGAGFEDYHYVFGQEQWLLVLEGTPSVRHPQGEDRLEPGDVVCFPEGPRGARQLLNRDGRTVRALLLSTTGLPVTTHHPDTGIWRIRNEPGQPPLALRQPDPG